MFVDKKIAEWRCYVGWGRLRHWITEHPTSFRIVFRRSRSTIYQRRHVLTRYAATCVLIKAAKLKISWTVQNIIFFLSVTVTNKNQIFSNCFFFCKSLYDLLLLFLTSNEIVIVICILFYLTDITPNGTLRRRRSRIPCEDDDGNLMDFLRTSGHDNTRERKSWGSLGI